MPGINFKIKDLLGREKKREIGKEMLQSISEATKKKWSACNDIKIHRFHTHFGRNVSEISAILMNVA